MDRNETGSYTIIFVLWLLVFVSGSQALIVAPILPRIGEQLTAPESLLGTLITSYAVAVGVFALITGPISDHIGRRRILLAGTGLMAVGLALHGLAWDFTSLLGVRALAGVAGGILNGASVAYVGDYFSREERGWANGWVFSGFAAGQIAGIPLGSILAEQFGFRWPFLAFAALMVGTFALIYVVLPQPDVELATEPLTVHNALGGYWRLLQRADVAAASVIFLIMFLGNALYTTYLPTWLEATLGMGGAAIGGMFFVGGIANVIAGPQAGKFSDRVGRKRVIVGASLAITVVMAATTVAAVGVWAIYAVFFVVMGLFASRATPFQTLLTEMVGGDRRGSFMSLTVGIGQVGSGVGGALAGGAYATLGYPGTTVAAAASMLVIAVLVWVYLPETVGVGGVLTPTPTERPDATPAPSASAGVSGTEPTPMVHDSALIEFACRGSGDALCGPTAEGGHRLDRLAEREQRRREEDGTLSRSSQD